MKQVYEVKCGSLVGKHNKTYTKGTLINEDCIYADAIPELVAAGLIAEWPKEAATKTDAESSNSRGRK